MPLSAAGTTVYETSTTTPEEVELEVSEISSDVSRRLLRQMTNSAVKVSSDGGSYGTGTYFKYRSSRFVLTARHVVEGSDQIFIEINPLNRVPATIVYVDPDRDIAILTCEELVGKKPMRYRDRDIPRQGINLFYAGYPSRHNLLTITGTVAGYETWGKNKIIMHSYGWPGASGSAVFDSRGRIVGVLVAVDVSQMPIHGHMAHRIVEDIVWVEPTSELNIRQILRSIE
jgi:S1-C subfamily serine protease